MKKFISGLIIGALLMTGASAFADSVSLVGQKVQGIFSIEKAGTKVADAVIINSTAYAPVRAVAEATGASLTVEGKTIIMTETGTSTGTISTISGEEEKTLAELLADRDKLAADIDEKTAGAAEFKKYSVNFWETMINENPNSTTIPKWEEALERDKDILNQRQAEITILQQQLTEIDIQIAELQK